MTRARVGLAEPQGLRNVCGMPLHRVQSPWPDPAMVRFRSCRARSVEERRPIRFTLVRNTTRGRRWRKRSKGVTRHFYFAGVDVLPWFHRGKAFLANFGHLAKQGCTVERHAVRAQPAA
jgi:hypothetical protein